MTTKDNDELMNQAEQLGLKINDADSNKDITETVMDSDKAADKVAKNTDDMFSHLKSFKNIVNQNVVDSTETDSPDESEVAPNQEDDYTLESDDMPDVNDESVDSTTDTTISSDINMSMVSDILIELVDTVDNAKWIKSITAGGNFTKKLNAVLKPILKKGYVVQGTLPAAPDNNKTVINLAHKTKNVDRVKIVEQQIQYCMADDSKAPDDVKRKLKFTQSGTKDLVTGRITWQDDSETLSFTKMPSPNRKGYIPDKDYVPEQEVTVDNDNFNVNLDTRWVVNYVAEILRIKIQIIDDDAGGKMLHEFLSTGYDGGILDINVNDVAKDMIKQHYIVSRNNLPDKIKFESGKSPIYQIHLIHEHGEVDDRASLESQGTYEIKLVDKNDAELSDPVIVRQRFSRHGEKDYVTGRVQYSDWQKTGEVPRIQTTPEKLVNQDDETLIPMSTKVIIPDITPDSNQTVSQVYYAPVQIVTLNYYQANKLVTSTSLRFQLKDDELITIDQLKHKLSKLGYKFLPDQKLPETFSYNETLDDKRSYRVDVEAIMAAKKETKVVKRTIAVTMPNGARRAFIEKAELTRDVTINMSKQKGEAGWHICGDWSENVWDEYVPAQVTGYLPSQQKVVATVVTGKTQDQEINISYFAQNQPVQQTTPESEIDEPEQKSNFFERIKAYFLPHKDDTEDNGTMRLNAPKSDKQAK